MGERKLVLTSWTIVCNKIEIVLTKWKCASSRHLLSYNTFTCSFSDCQREIHCMHIDSGYLCNICKRYLCHHILTIVTNGICFFSLLLFFY